MHWSGTKHPNDLVERVNQRTSKSLESFSLSINKNTQWRELSMGSICIRHTALSLHTAADHSLVDNNDDDDVIYAEAIQSIGVRRDIDGFTQNQSMHLTDRTWTPTTRTYYDDLIYSWSIDREAGESSVFRRWSAINVSFVSNDHVRLCLS